MIVEYAVITMPTVWKEDESIGNDLNAESQKQREEMRELHEMGFHVTQTTSFVIQDIGYVTYYLERK